MCKRCLEQETEISLLKEELKRTYRELDDTKKKLALDEMPWGETFNVIPYKDLGRWDRLNRGRD